MRKRVNRGKQAAVGLNFAVLMVCLGLLAPIQAQEVAQARELSAVGQAKDLTNLAPTPMLAQGTPTPTAEAEDDEPVDLLGEFNVTAQRRRVTERESTQTTFVVTREEIKASGATTVSDALKLVPSINFVDDLGGVDTTSFNQVRGLDDQRFVFLIDGKTQTRASNNRAVNISKTPTVNVERIEVVTGGSTLRYGADAIGGVINVITRLPEGPSKVAVGVDLGSYGFSQYSFEYSGSNGVSKDQAGYFGFQLGYERRSVLNNYTQTVNVTAPAGGEVRVINDFNAPVITNSFSASSPAFGFYSYSDLYYGKAIFKPGKDHLVTLSAQQQNTRRGYAFYYGPNCRFRPQGNVNRGVASPVPYFECRTERYYDYLLDEYYVPYGPYDNKIDQTEVSVAWDWNLSELNTLSTVVAINNSWENYPISTGQRFLANRTISAQVRYTAELYKGNTLNAGAEFITLRSIQVPFIGAQTGVPLPEGTVIYGRDISGRVPFFREISRWAIYLTEDLRFFDNALVVNFGSRLTNDVFFGTFTTSGGGFRYNFGSPDPQTAPFGLRFNYQQTFKAPGLTQLFLSSRTVQANPNLVPEVGSGYDIGLDVSLSPTALFRATYYRIDLTNAILEGAQVDRVTRQSINAQAFLSTGFEFSFNWKLDKNWNVLLSQTFTDARPVGIPGIDPQDRQGRPTSGGFFYNYQNTNTPFNNTGLRVQYTSPALTATLSGRIVSERPQRGNFNVAGYSTWDLTTSIPLTKELTLTGGVFNIFNSKYELFSSTSGYVNPGTTFRLGVDAAF